MVRPSRKFFFISPGTIFKDERIIDFLRAFVVFVDRYPYFWAKLAKNRGIEDFKNFTGIYFRSWGQKIFFAGLAFVVFKSIRKILQIFLMQN